MTSILVILWCAVLIITAVCMLLGGIVAMIEAQDELSDDRDTRP